MTPSSSLRRIRADDLQSGKNSPKTNHGRDHHGRCFSTWVTGGGFKRGFDYGKTDDYSYNIVEDPVHINDFNATILHALGINHERFSVKYQGLDSRLTAWKARALCTKSWKADKLALGMSNRSEGPCRVTMSILGKTICFRHTFLLGDALRAEEFRAADQTAPTVEVADAWARLVLKGSRYGVPHQARVGVFEQRSDRFPAGSFPSVLRVFRLA